MEWVYFSETQCTVRDTNWLASITLRLCTAHHHSLALRCHRQINVLSIVYYCRTFYSLDKMLIETLSTCFCCIVMYTGATGVNCCLSLKSACTVCICLTESIYVRNAQCTRCKFLVLEATIRQTCSTQVRTFLDLSPLLLDLDLDMDLKAMDLDLAVFSASPWQVHVV